MKTRYYALYWLWKHICAIDQAWGLRWLDIGQVLSCVFLDPDEVWDIAILTLTSPTDINLPTTSALVLVTKDSFVSLVTNLNKKSNVCTVANRTDMKTYWAQYELEPNQKGWLRGYGVIKNNTHFWIHRLSKFQSLLRLIYLRYGPNTCSQRRRGGRS